MINKTKQNKIKTFKNWYFPKQHKQKSSRTQNLGSHRFEIDYEVEQKRKSSDRRVQDGHRRTRERRVRTT